jgi:hypothetical protein
MTELPVESLADLDDHLIGGLVAEGVVDGPQLVDTDGEIGSRHARAQARGHGLAQRLAQARAIEMPGELVVIGEPFQPLLLYLAVGDQAEHAHQAARRAGGIELGSAAILDPDRGTLVVVQPIFALEELATRGGSRETALSQRAVLRMDPVGKTLARDDGGDIGCAKPRQDGAVPFQPVAREIPDIGEVARGLESAVQLPQRRLGVRGHVSAALVMTKRVESRVKRGCPRHQTSRLQL